jgi:16S rRNA (guanine966-N2)-methyltransferase
VTRVFRRNASDLGPVRGGPFGLVFLDPPYGQGIGERALASALEGGWIAADALIVWEESTAPLPPPGFRLLDQRSYGGTIVTLLRAEASRPAM